MSRLCHSGASTPFRELSWAHPASSEKAGFSWRKMISQLGIWKFFQFSMRFLQHIREGPVPFTSLTTLGVSRPGQVQGERVTVGDCCFWPSHPLSPAPQPACSRIRGVHGSVHGGDSRAGQGTLWEQGKAGRVSCSQTWSEGGEQEEAGGWGAMLLPAFSGSETQGPAGQQAHPAPGPPTGGRACNTPEPRELQTQGSKNAPKELMG